jgi:hypothetical protein
MSDSARHGSAKPIILVAVLIVAVAAAVWLWSRPASQPGVDAGRTIAETFLKHIQEGHPDQAWEGTTAEFKSAQGKESFVRELKPVKFLKEPLEFASVQTVTVQQQPRTEYSFRAKTGETVRVVLGREGNSWKVDRWSR